MTSHDKYTVNIQSWGEPLVNLIAKMAGHQIRRLHQISVGAFLARMSEESIDITQVQFAALSVVSDSPEIDQTSLAQRIACDRATTGGVIDRLEKKGFLRRVASKTDRRIKGLVVTAKGREVYEKMLPVVWVVQEDILRGLTAQEQKEFLRLLMKATHASDGLSRVPISPAS